MNLYMLLMFFASFLAGFSQILLKKSANQKHSHLIKEYLNVRVITSYTLLGLSLFLNIYAYRGVEYKYAPVFAASTYLFSMILSGLILKENIRDKLLGNFIILCGILISLMNF